MYTYSHTCVILYSISLWLSGCGLSGYRAISTSQAVWMTPRGAEICVSLTHDTLVPATCCTSASGHPEALQDMCSAQVNC